MADNQTPIQPEKEPSSPEDIFAHEDREALKAPEIKERPLEIRKEAAPEIKPGRKTEAAAEEEAARRRYVPPPATAPVSAPVSKSQELVKIESILAENLDEFFLKMTPQEQMAFKVEGEKTAGKIEKLLQETKVKVKEILNLIKNWLKMLLGINKFFLEQEAKIKTDRLLNLREQKQK